MGQIKNVLIDYVNNVLKEARESFKGDELLDLECELIESHLEKSVPVPAEWQNREMTFYDVLEHYNKTKELIIPSLETMSDMNSKQLSSECVSFFDELSEKGELYNKLLDKVKKRLEE
jgi:ATP-dependent helicase/DNAse subunit B